MARQESQSTQSACPIVQRDFIGEPRATAPRNLCRLLLSAHAKSSSREKKGKSTRGTWVRIFAYFRPLTTYSGRVLGVRRDCDARRKNEIRCGAKENPPGETSPAHFDKGHW